MTTIVTYHARFELTVTIPSGRVRTVVSPESPSVTLGNASRTPWIADEIPSIATAK